MELLPPIFVLVWLLIVMTILYSLTITVFMKKRRKICFLAVVIWNKKKRATVMSTRNPNKRVSLLRIVLPCCRGVRNYVGAIGYCTKRYILRKSWKVSCWTSNSWSDTWLRARIQIVVIGFENKKKKSNCRHFAEWAWSDLETESIELWEQLSNFLADLVTMNTTGMATYCYGYRLSA